MSTLLLPHDRHTLLEIGSSIAHRKPDFEFLNAGTLFTNTASEPFVWAARRGNAAGKKGRELASSSDWDAVPFDLLSQPFCWLTFSHCNWLCELRARISYQRETRDCCVICFTETWMSAMVPDSAHVHHSDRPEVGASVSISTTRGVMKGTYTLLNPSAPLIWNFICFFVDHSGYRGNLQQS